MEDDKKVLSEEEQGDSCVGSDFIDDWGEDYDGYTEDEYVEDSYDEEYDEEDYSDDTLNQDVSVRHKSNVGKVVAIVGSALAIIAGCVAIIKIKRRK